jgi:LPXTG-motif cell wall-anchored protein
MKNSTNSANKNFRTWKSGKSWLYASALVAAVAGGIGVSTTTVKADGQILSSTNASGTNNTATGNLGSDASAGADNASYANSVTASQGSSAQLLQDGTTLSNGTAETANSENTNGSYAVNVTVSNTADSSLASAWGVSTTSSNYLNANGAVQAGSGASSSISFDIKQADSITANNALSGLFDGNHAYQWTVQAPGDLTDAGLSTDVVNVTFQAEEDGAGNVVINNNEALAQTAGGSFELINEGVVNYVPNSTVASETFVPTSSAASALSSMASVVASMSSAVASLSAAAITASSMYIQTSDYNYLLAMIDDQTSLANLQDSLVNYETTVSAYQVQGTVTVAVSDAAMVSTQYTMANSGISTVMNAIAGVLGDIGSIVPQIVAWVNDAMSGVLGALDQILDGNLSDYLVQLVINVVKATTGYDQSDKKAFIMDFLNSIGLGNVSINGFINGVSGNLVKLIDFIADSFNLSAAAIAQVTYAVDQFGIWINSIGTSIQSVIAQYQQNANAAAQYAQNIATAMQNAGSIFNGSWTENYLASVTDNGNGSYTINGGNHSGTQALGNDIARTISGLLNPFIVTVREMLTLPDALKNIFNTANDTDWLSGNSVIGSMLSGVVNGIANFIGGIINGAVTAWDNLMGNGWLTNGISWLSNTVAGAISGAIAGIGLDLTSGANVVVTTGFTAQDPTAQIEKNLATANYYYQGQAAVTGADQNNYFVPETFEVTPNLVNGSSQPTQSTTVMYQVSTDASTTTPPVVTPPENSNELNVADIYLYDTQKFYENEMVLHVTNSDGTTGDPSKVTYTVTSKTATADGEDDLITFSYVDPVNGNTYTATAVRHLIHDQTSVTPTSTETAATATDDATTATTATAAAPAETAASMTLATAATQLPINTSTAGNGLSSDQLAQVAWTTTPGGTISYPANNYAVDPDGNLESSAVASATVSLASGTTLNPATLFNTTDQGGSAQAVTVVAGEFIAEGSTTGQAASTTSVTLQNGTYTFIAGQPNAGGVWQYGVVTVVVGQAQESATISGHNSTIYVGDSWSSQDNLDSITIDGTTYTSSADIPSGYTITSTNTVNTSKAGVYTVTYNIVNASGDVIATTTQTVTVLNTPTTTPETPKTPTKTTTKSTSSSQALPKTGDVTNMESSISGLAMLAGVTTVIAMKQKKRHSN